MNPELEGRRLPRIGPYTVGREKVREFARAVLAGSAYASDPEVAAGAGYADVVAPPTFPIVVQQHALDRLLAEPDTGIDFRMVVHGEQRFAFSRPLVAGDELLAELTVTSVKTLAGNSMVTAETRMSDLDGELVVTAVSTLVVRGEA